MLNKFIETLAKIRYDKLSHYFYGSIAGFIFTMLFKWFGVIIVLVLALLKEVFDIIEDYQKGNELRIRDGIIDTAFTVAPAIFFCHIYLFF